MHWLRWVAALGTVAASTVLELDAPGGRYTQTRVASDGIATMVWNGAAGLRLSRCTDSKCSAVRPPVTVPGTDPDPRYIRMELMDGGAPVLAYSAANDTEAHVTWCDDVVCSTSTTVVVLRAQRIRHNDLAMLDTATGEVQVVVGTSDTTAKSGSTLLASHLARGAILRSATIAEASAPFAINTTTGLPTGGLEMPALVVGASAATSHVAYWDVVGRSLRLVLNAMSAHPHTLTVASPASAAAADSSPGAWVRVVREEGSSLVVLAFFDLQAGSLQVATCDDIAQTCTSPRQLDAVGHRDVSDYGAGAFPEFRLLPAPARFRIVRDLGRGLPALLSVSLPALAYFSQGPGPAGNGQLKLLACADAACSSAAVSELASGAAGFGRDASLARAHDGSLLVSFLDLMGKDDPGAMVARLLVRGL